MANKAMSADQLRTTKGIIFSAPMVRALLDGRKTQTRRLLNPQPLKWEARVIDITDPFFCDDEQAWGQIETTWHYPVDMPMGEPLREDWRPLKLPYAVGDRLYVREAFGFNHYEYHIGRAPKVRPVELTDEYISYRATEDDCGISNELRYRPSIHMPRWASRLWLSVTEVRVERLRDISGADAVAEGVRSRLPENGMAQQDYADLWNSLHTKPGTRWEDNPWVVAVSFDVHEGNVDAIGERP